MLNIRTFTFSPIQENTYVLYNDSGEAAIVDPGCYFDAEKDELKAFVESKKLRPKLLLNTHCHLDHVFGNKFVADTWGLVLHLHPNEVKVLERAPASGLMFDLPFDNYTGAMEFLNEGDIVMLGEDELQVILAPGHSPGSICFYYEPAKFLVGGDVIFYNSIGRTDLPGGNHEQLLESIREKIFTLQEDVKIYPGHGESTTVGREKKDNPFLM